MDKMYRSGIVNLTCPICSKKFFSTGSLIHHYNHSHPAIKKTPEKGYTCSCCKKFCPNIKEMTKHVKSCHSVQLSWIKKTSEMERYIKPCLNICLETQKEHVLENSTMDKCIFCEKKLHLHERLNHYITKHGDGKKFICSACGKGFKQWGSIEDHIHSHNMFDKFKCLICGKGYRKAQDCRNHVRIKHWREAISRELDLELEGGPQANFTPFGMC